MKNKKIIYWAATGIFSLMMLFSGYNYFTAPELKEAFVHLGFPDYFRIELAVAKILGALALVLPFVPKGFKQFAYAGFTINLTSAFIAHSSKGDPFNISVMPLIFLAVLVVSYIYYNKQQQIS
ncbi:DoxX family protein [Niabella aquatica]